MVGALTHFLLDKFIPTASGELLIWLSEWQTLIVGLALLIAGGLWTRAILRSNRRTAQLVSQSLRLMTEAFAESSRGAPESSGLSAVGASSGRDDLEQRLDRLRGVIRGALSVIPQTGDRVDGNIAQLLRNISNFSLDDGRGNKGLSEAQTRALVEVEKGISTLGTANVETMKCADAWEALVRLHRAARIARDSGSGAARNKAA
jgi:hypothetical protein